MPENENVQPQQTIQDNRGVVHLRYEKAVTNYANMALVSGTPEEVILSFGLNVMPPTQQREVNIEVTSRIIMSYLSAKRLALTLSGVIQRYEAAHGVLDLGAQAQAQAQPGPQK